MKHITVENVTGSVSTSKKIPIYKADHQTSIVRRIASAFDTLPQLLSISLFNLDTNVLFYDFKTFVRSNFKGTLSLVLRSYSSKCNFIVNEKNRDLILATWIKEEFKNKDNSVPDGFFLLGVKNNIREYLNDQPRFGIVDYDFQDDDDDIKIIIKNMKDYMSNYDAILSQFQRKEKQSEESLREYETLSPLERDIFISETTTFLTRTKNSTIQPDIRLLFDHIKTTELITFASYGNMYKVHSGQVILPEWTEQNAFSHIVLKIKSDEKSFSTCTVRIENNKVLYETELQKYDEEVINVIAKLLGVEIEETTEEKISGHFYMKFFFDKTLLLDMIATNRVLSKLLFTNEIIKASRERKSIYTYFEDADRPEYGTTTLSLSNQSYKKLPDKLKIEARLNKINFVRCRISKAKNRLAVQYIMDTLCNMLPIYELEKNKINREYIKYIPDFETNKPDEISIKEDKAFDLLRSNVPDLFVKVYTRQCFNSPAIVDETAISSQDKKNKSLYMKYPKDTDDAKWYTCSDDTEYKYIGLKKPKQLKGLDLNKYPYIPCCYKENQIEKSGTKYYKYEKNIKDDQEKKQQDTIKTNKFVGFNHFGLLPTSLNNLFTILDTDEQEFFRKGVASVYHSFLECVYEAVDDSFQTASKETRETMMAQKIKEINGDKNLLSIGKQEMFDSTEIRIEKEKYTSPERWVSILSEHFDCFIYVYRNSELIIPRHKNGHYELFRNMTTLSPVVLVYEHEGGEFDTSPVPRCELIARRKEDRTKYKHYFSKDKKHYTNVIRQIYSSLKRTKYTHGFITKDKTYKLNDVPVKILKQAVDSYGKTRLLQIKYKDQTVDIYTTPIQPLRAPIENYWNPSPVKNSIINELFKGYKKERTVNDKLHAIEGEIGNVLCTIPINASSVKPSRKIYLPLVSKRSVYEEYMDFRTKTTYMIEHILHSYSAWSDDMKSKDIEQFLSSKVNFTSSVDTKYSLFFSEKGKVTVPYTLRNKILYSIRLMEQRDKNGLTNFRYKTTVENAYHEPEDFKKYTNEVITTDDQLWNEYIKRGDVKQKYYVSLNKAVKDLTNDENGRFMFFFSNKLVSDKTFILLKCVDRKDAILQSANWIKYRYILPSASVSNIDTVLPDIYVYLSSDNIKSKIRDGKAKILITKINDVEMSFAIMEI